MYVSPQAVLLSVAVRKRCAPHSSPIQKTDHALFAIYWVSRVWRTGSFGKEPSSKDTKTDTWSVTTNCFNKTLHNKARSNCDFELTVTSSEKAQIMAAVSHKFLYCFLAYLWCSDICTADDPLPDDSLVWLDVNRRASISCDNPDATLRVNQVQLASVSETETLEQEDRRDPCTKSAVQYLQELCNGKTACRLQRNPDNSDNACGQTRLLIHYQCPAGTFQQLHLRYC